MPSAARLSETIHTIYRAALEPDLWPDLIASLLDDFRSNHAQILVLDPRAEAPLLSFVNDAPESKMAAYNDYYRLIDPRMPAMLANGGVVQSRGQMVADDEFERTEVYCDFLRPNEIEQNISLVTDTRQGHEAFVSFMRAEKLGSFSEREHALFELLAPHFVQATRVFRTLSAHRLEAGIGHGALDGLADGVVLLGGDGRVLFANARARRIMADGDGLRVTREGRLVCARVDESTALDRLLDAILRRSEGIEVSAGGNLAVSRPSGQRPYSLLVSPFQVPSGPIAGAISGAIVLLCDPEDVPRTAAEQLSRLHGLTPAEARLAAAFVETASLPRAADALGITHETARGTLKSIFAKTETNNQAALMKYLLTAAPR